MEYTVTSVEERTVGTAVGNRRMWYVLQRDPNGEVQAHAFPPDALEWRAAEYHIDPTDTATLLDIVLHEPHLTPEQASDAHPHHLHQAPTIEQARTTHLAHIADAKTRVSVVDPDGHLAPIHARGCAPEAVKVRRERVRVARATRGLVSDR